MMKVITGRLLRRTARTSARGLLKVQRAALRSAAAALGGVLPRRKPRRAQPKRRPLGRFVQIQGVRVHYIARGKGRPIILLHGNGAMAEEFVISGLVDQLARQYRVIAIDRPGFGYTERPRSQVWTPF